MSSTCIVESRETRVLDAARDCILSVGWRRTTITDVARRAGVSRMTVYRRWPDMHTLIADLLTRELDAGALLRERDAADPAALARAVTAAVVALRSHPLFVKVVQVDPELLLPYLLTRLGRTQLHYLELLTAAIRAGQQAGTMRSGEPALLARGVLLAAYGFALSAHTMTTDAVSQGELEEQLGRMVEGYLR